MTTMALVASAGPVTSKKAQQANELSNKDSSLGGLWSCASDSDHGKHTSLVATDFLVRALGLVSLRYDRRNVATGGAVAVGSGHGRHDAGLGCGHGGLAMVMAMVLRLGLRLKQRLKLTAGLDLWVGWDERGGAVVEVAAGTGDSGSRGRRGETTQMLHEIARFGPDK